MGAPLHPWGLEGTGRSCGAFGLVAFGGLGLLRKARRLILPLALPSCVRNAPVRPSNLLIKLGNNRFEGFILL